MPDIAPLQVSVASVLNAKNHFAVLGLEPRRCGGAELRKAYKQTALKVHPDKCSEAGAIEAFRRLQEAFAVLSDPSLHARYAQTLAHAQAARAANVAAGRARERDHFVGPPLRSSDISRIAQIASRATGALRSAAVHEIHATKTCGHRRPATRASVRCLLYV